MIRPRQKPLQAPIRKALQDQLSHDADSHQAEGDEDGTE